MPDSLERPINAPFIWYGGKGNMLGRLMPLVPRGGRPYCEPYAGVASLFFARDPAPVEVLNDLDGRIVNFFRVLQSKEKGDELIHRLTFTPYARSELGRAIDILRNPQAHDDVTNAWAFCVAHNFGISGCTPRTTGNWGRTFVSCRGMAGTVSRWIQRLESLEAFRARLMRAQIDSVDAIKAIEYWDNEDAVFYVDPPYHHDTRADKRGYAVEQDHDHHEKLVSVLLERRGAITLSCYWHDVYRPLVDAGWERIDFETACYAASRNRNSGLQGNGAATEKVPRVETVLINPKCAKMLGRLEL